MRAEERPGHVGGCVCPPPVTQCAGFARLCSGLVLRVLLLLVVLLVNADDLERPSSREEPSEKATAGPTAPHVSHCETTTLKAKALLDKLVLPLAHTHSLLHMHILQRMKYTTAQQYATRHKPKDILTLR